MKRTWKWIAMMLAVVMLLTGSLGCQTGKQADADDAKRAEAAAPPVEEPAEEPTAEPTEEPTAEPTEEPAAEFTRGVWEGTVYANEYLNLRFALPEGFIASSDEEMAAMMQIGFEELDNYSEFQKKLAEIRTIYDMMAASPTNGSTVIVMLENLRMFPGGDSLSAQDYAAVLAEGLAAAEVQGMTYAMGEGYESEMAGETWFVMPASIGDGLMRQDYYLRRVDDYMLAICLTYLPSMGGTQEELAAAFSAY